MKEILVFTSDTHFPVKKAIPECDYFFHAGDLLSEGSIDEFKANFEWLKNIEAKNKYFTPGNHDYYIDERPGAALQAFRRCGFTVIGLPNNPDYEIIEMPNGLVVGAMPLVQGLDNRWAFCESSFYFANPERYAPLGAENFRERFDKAVYDTVQKMLLECDIILTHAPIYGFLDKNMKGIHSGDKIFRKALDETKNRKTQLWVHGHKHESVGHASFSQKGEKDLFIYNVAMCNRSNEHAYHPTVIEWSKENGFVCLRKPGTPY